MTEESYLKACAKSVKKNKKTIKKQIGEWPKPFMGPAGGPPHEDEEAGDLFKVYLGGGVMPEDVLPLIEKMTPIIGLVREDLKASLDRVYAGVISHLEELDLDV